MNAPFRIFSAALLTSCLVGCGLLDEVMPQAASVDGASQLPANPGDQMGFKGDLMYGDRAWTPNECVWAAVEGRQGMIFANEGEGLALAVWKDGVPDGESNVWFVDMAKPPEDNNFQVGSAKCGRVRVQDAAEGSDALLSGATKVSCDGFESELHFRNCVNSLQGSAAASVAWPPL